MNIAQKIFNKLTEDEFIINDRFISGGDVNLKI